ncbi:MAG: hypothetical protein LH473_13390 [Chitinophagales bacterium]|nr:hypothetical protein [Chitinophagales bacterium]
MSTNKIKITFELLHSVFVCFILLLFSNRICAQNLLQKKYDFRYGGVGAEYLYAICPLRTAGSVLGGSSSSAISGDKTDVAFGELDYWILKIDGLGNKIWDNDFGGSSGNILSDLRETTDNGLILGGFSNSQISGDKTQDTWGGMDDFDIWIIKTDSLGNKQWDKDFGTISKDELVCINQTKDGGYIIGGNTSAGISGDKSQATWGDQDYWIIKIDSLGNKEWDKDFGTSNFDKLNCVQQTNDGGYLIGGYTDAGISGDKTEDTWGLTDYWIIKTDSFGNKEWDKDFGGLGNDLFTWLEKTNDGGYIIGGYSESNSSGNKTQDTWGYTRYGYYNDFDFWILKLDSIGNILWDKDFGGNSSEVLTRLSITSDEGYLLSGVSISSASGDKTEDNIGGIEMWMIKTDYFGNRQWDKTARTSLLPQQQKKFS